ncbi:MAG TPA: tetratricopeptide repeat protein [Polyangiaceae bacterium]|nr:tetratricopeptide repeat protein [Polyangiaceae bacterium]
MPFSPNVGHGPAPLIGRRAEIAKLENFARTAFSDGVPQIVTIVGPARMGKSRVISEFIEELRQKADAPRIYGAEPRRERSYGLLRALLRSRFGLTEGMSERDALVEVRKQVSAVLEDRKVGDVCHFLGQLLDLPFEGSSLTRAVEALPQQALLLRRTVLKSFFESDEQSGPLCLIFEDLHAADTDSLTLLRYLLESLTGRIFVLCATRPELLNHEPGWFDFGGARHHRLDLEPVTPDAAAAIMRALLEPCEGGPPEPLIRSGVDLAAGNPGLLESMVRVFHDCGVLGEAGPLASSPSWRVNLAQLASVKLPLTMDDALEVRIAALNAHERKTLEHAAAMGKAITLGGLTVLSRIDRGAPEFWNDEDDQDLEELRSTLKSLVRRDFLVPVPESGVWGEQVYAFKSQPEYDRISARTSLAARRRYHQALADWLSNRPPRETGEEYLVTLASHLQQAGSTTRAGLAYIQAADLVRATYAASKAQQYYERGLELLGGAEGRRRIEALNSYGDTLVWLGRTAEALGAYRDMLDGSFQLNLKQKGGIAHNRIGRILRERGKLDEALAHFETAIRLFDAEKDHAGVATCHDDVGRLKWLLGDYEFALERLKIALSMRKDLGDRRAVAQSLHSLGVVWRDHGQRAQAREALEGALAMQNELGDQPGIAETLSILGRLAEDRNDLIEALQRHRAAYELLKDLGERNRIASLLTTIGELQYHLGKPDQAIELMKEAELMCDDLGDMLQLARAKRGLAKAYLLLGDLKKARTNVKLAIDLFGQLRSKPHLAIALRTLGEVAAAGAWGESQSSRALEYFMRSIGLCKELGSDVELARSYRAFADYVTASPALKDNTDLFEQATSMTTAAEEIFARLKAEPQAAPQRSAAQAVPDSAKALN